MSLDKLASPVLVESENDLGALLRDLEQQDRIGVDTESNSLHAYRERVCLIQFSTRVTDYILDPLALDDLNPLANIFSNNRIEKIFHASEYDILCLRRDFGFLFSNIFDTMQAGRILGRKLVGLDHLLKEIFGVVINKRFQKADWRVRPLSPDLLLYARLDTHYLIPLRDSLQVELELKGLWQLAQEDFHLACNLNSGKTRSETPAWMRFGTRHKLTLRNLTVINELLGWREMVAERLDRPPFKVLDDDKLVEIARANPSTFDELSKLTLTSKQIQAWGGSILEAVRRGEKNPFVQRVSHHRPDEVHLNRLEMLKKWRKKEAAKLEVESDVVLPRTLLLALAESGPEGMTSIMEASPWRKEHFGAQILEVLRNTE